MSFAEAKALTRAFLHHHRQVHALGSYLSYRYSLITKKPKVWFHPPALMLEPTNICNLKCPLCPSGNGVLKRKRGFMDIDLYRKILAELKSKTGMLILWNQGEPFLHPVFYNMLELAARRRFYTMTSTNASLELDIERIIRSGLNKIIISMDGIDRQSYDQYRINGNYELVLSNLQRLCSTKRKGKKSRLKIVWQFIAMAHNEHEIPRVRELARDFGVDALEIKTAQIYTNEDTSFLPEDEKYSRYKHKTTELKTLLLNRCRRLWTQPVINWDGEFAICCYDKDVECKIGNIKDQSFSELWFGDRMQRMRSQILNNRKAFPICRNCGEGIVQRV